MKPRHRERLEANLRERPLHESLKICMGYKGSYRYDDELFRAIANVYHQSRNMPRAGLYWVMTTDQSACAREAIDCAVRAFGPGLVDRLPIHVELKQLPAEVVARMIEAIRACGVTEPEKALRSRALQGDSRFAKYAFGIGCGIITLAILFIFGCGVYLIVKSVFF
jgi:hypothetical protein